GIPPPDEARCSFWHRHSHCTGNCRVACKGRAWCDARRNCAKLGRRTWCSSRWHSSACCAYPRHVRPRGGNFGRGGESATLPQASHAPNSLTPGVLLGIREIEKFPGLTYGLEEYLGL